VSGDLQQEESGRLLSPTQKLQFQHAFRNSQSANNIKIIVISPSSAAASSLPDLTSILHYIIIISRSCDP
jgi:hypothetical protein